MPNERYKHISNDEPFFSTEIQIPTYWSPQQALEIADFIGDIVSAILHVYSTDIAHYVEQNGPTRLYYSPDDDFSL